MTEKLTNKSSAKVFAVLDVLFLNFSDGFTQTEIIRETGLDSTAVHRYINTLVDAGYAEEIRGTKRFRPSHRLGQKAVQIMHSLAETERMTKESIQRLTRE